MIAISSVGIVALDTIPGSERQAMNTYINETKIENSLTCNLEVAGHLALCHAHEFLQRKDIEREVLGRLLEILPLEALRELRRRTLRVKPKFDAGDDDVRHSQKTDNLIVDRRFKSRGGRGGETADEAEPDSLQPFIWLWDARFALHGLAASGERGEASRPGSAL